MATAYLHQQLLRVKMILGCYYQKAMEQLGHWKQRKSSV